MSTSTNIPSPSPKIQEELLDEDVTSSAVKITMGSAEMDSKHYILPLDQPVVNLDCTEAFNGLSDQEKRYAHFLSQAAWAGGLAVLAQVCLTRQEV